MQSSCESGLHSGYKRKRGSWVQIVIDTLVHVLAGLVTPANDQERDQVLELCKAVQTALGHAVELIRATHESNPKQNTKALRIELR